MSSSTGTTRPRFDAVDASFVGLMVALAVVFLPSVIWGPSGWVPAEYVSAGGAALKLASLGLGAYWALRARSSFEVGNPARRGWTGLMLTLALFAAGQAVLAFYNVIRLEPAPHPMLGDVAFILGSVLLVPTLLGFVSYYRHAGILEVDLSRVTMVAAAAALVFGTIAYATVSVLWSSDTPWLGRVVSGAYPVLDCIMLVPTLALLRLLYPLHGGSLWGVWLRVLVGFASFTVADIVFAYATSVGVVGVTPVFDAMFGWGYAFVAWGAYRQHRLGVCDD